jgi:TM2 domain-containing membrane protein YozV
MLLSSVFFGVFGAHRLYLGKPLTASLMFFTLGAGLYGGWLSCFL